MRTRPASIATIVIAIGLALTAIGIARQVPYTFGGNGDVGSLRADLWAHGTAISPAIVALVFLGLFATIATRPTRGGRRSALWLAILAGAMLVAGLAEPAQQQAILFGAVDEAMPFLWAFHVGLIALILSAVGETRRRGEVATRTVSIAEPRLATGALAA
jgi:hypothetical protein